MTLRGATILTGTKVIGAQRDGALWRVVTQNAQGQTTHFARALVNAAGPRATEVLHGPVHVALKQGARLVRGWCAAAIS